MAGTRARDAITWVKKFREFKPSYSDQFKMPKGAGRKPGRHVRVRNNNPPQVIIDRLEANRTAEIDKVRISRPSDSLESGV